MLSVLKDMKVTRTVNSQTAGTSDVDGSVLDMTGFDSVVHIAILGDVTNTCVLSLENRESANSDGSSSSQSTNSKTADFTADATSADNKVIVSEVHRPTQRYCFPRLKRGTANAVVDGVISIQFNSKTMPTTQPAAMIASVLAGPLA